MAGHDGTGVMTVRDETFDAIVLGAGAAGLMCAATAGQRGRRVALIEHGDKAGAKILISGGGRCNFTNLDIRPDRFLSDNPHFCRSALSRYTAADFIALVTRYAIGFHEKTLGQLFCDGSARAIVAMLLAECAAGQVDLRVNQTIRDVTRDDLFRVATDDGVISAPVLVLATGGLSIPKMGATGFSYDLARRFGLDVTETRPGLVPLKAGNEDDVFDPSLAGVALPAEASIGPRTFAESLLFTHRGVSGPAILQISSYWREGRAISINLQPNADVAAHLVSAKRTRPRAKPHTVLADVLPARLAQALAMAHLPDIELANISDRTIADFARAVHTWRFDPSGSEGYAKAEVTVGGIDTRGLSSKTMGATGVPGLFAIGEAVDVTGWLGGYNFQWAWSSGWCAGQAI
ncbi:MAG: NAD(P)/FAD-dependent oxidoreductase [Hyphomicrobium sp.]